MFGDKFSSPMDPMAIFLVRPAESFVRIRACNEVPWQVVRYLDDHPS